MARGRNSEEQIKKNVIKKMGIQNEREKKRKENRRKKAELKWK